MFWKIEEKGRAGGRHTGTDLEAVSVCLSLCIIFLEVGCQGEGNVVELRGLITYRL